MEFLVSTGRQINEVHVSGTAGPQRYVRKRAAQRVCRGLARSKKSHEL